MLTLAFGRHSAKAVGEGIAMFNVCGMKPASEHLSLVFDLMHAEDCNSVDLVSDQDLIDMAQELRAVQTREAGENAEDEGMHNEERSSEEEHEDAEEGGPYDDLEGED